MVHKVSAQSEPTLGHVKSEHEWTAKPRVKAKHTFMSCPTR